MNVIPDVNRHANDLWVGRASILYSSDYAVLTLRLSIIPPRRHKPIGLQLALNLGARRGQNNPCYAAVIDDPTIW